MCVGYSAFANQGITSASMMVTKITDDKGNVIANFVPIQKQALSQTGYVRMNECLQSVVRRGTGRSMNSLGAQMGGKTGTTDFKADGWFMGFTPKLVFGAWVGGESKYIHLNLIGGSSALPLCKRFMSKVYADKSLPYKRNDKFIGFENVEVYKEPLYTGRKSSSSSSSETTAIPTTVVEDVFD